MKGTKLVIALSAALTLTSNVSSVEADEIDLHIFRDRHSFITSQHEDTLDEVILNIVKKDSKTEFVENKDSKEYRLGKTKDSIFVSRIESEDLSKSLAASEALSPAVVEAPATSQESNIEEVVLPTSQVEAEVVEEKPSEDVQGEQASQEDLQEPVVPAQEVVREEEKDQEQVEATVSEDQVNVSEEEEVLIEGQSRLATDTIELIPVEEETEDEWMTIDYKGETAYIAVDFVELEEETEEESLEETPEVVVEDLPEEQSEEEAEESSLAEAEEAIVAEALIEEETVEEEVPPVEEAPVVEEAAQVEETAVVEEAPVVVEEAPVVEEVEAAESNTSAGMEALVNEAYQTVGLPYVWAGSSYSGFDCSGLTSYLYQQHFGIWIGRTTSEQYNAGYGVSVSEMKPGDVLCFQNNWSSSCDHVGIYVGNGQYVHAATEKRGVVIDSTSGNYFQNNLVSVRRIVD